MARKNRPFHHKESRDALQVTKILKVRLSNPTPKGEGGGTPTGLKFRLIQSLNPNPNSPLLTESVLGRFWLDARRPSGPGQACSSPTFDIGRLSAAHTRRQSLSCFPAWRATSSGGNRHFRHKCAPWQRLVLSRTPFPDWLKLSPGKCLGVQVAGLTECCYMPPAPRQHAYFVKTQQQR